MIFNGVLQIKATKNQIKVCYNKRAEKFKAVANSLKRGDAYERFFDLGLAPERSQRDCIGSVGINVLIWNVSSSVINVYRQESKIKNNCP